MFLDGITAVEFKVDILVIDIEGIDANLLLDRQMLVVGPEEVYKLDLPSLGAQGSGFQHRDDTARRIDSPLRINTFADHRMSLVPA